MKYAVIVTYTSGERTGAVIEADSMLEAWQKLDDLFSLETLRAVLFAEILTPEREG